MDLRNRAMMIPYDTGGFTLIEVVVALGIFTAVMVLVTMFGLDIANFANDYGERLSSQDELLLAMNALTTELRSTAPAANGSYPIVAAGSSSFTFYTDFDANSTTDRIRYFIGTSTLEKGIITPTGTPAQYPSSSETVRSALRNVIRGSFSYFDTAYSGVEAPLSFPITDLSLIRVVKFTVTIDQATTTKPAAVSSTIVIALRNLKSN